MQQKKAVICGHADKKHVAMGMCSACYARHRRALNPGRDQKYQNTYITKHAGRKNASARKYRANNRDRVKAAQLKRRFGITLIQYHEMLSMQNGLCAICLEAPAIDVDHNHKTGEIRALLCKRCNKVLGLMDEQVSKFKNAIEYLDKYGANALPYKQASSVAEMPVKHLGQTKQLNLLEFCTNV